jgi:hypothetical protein
MSTLIASSGGIRSAGDQTHVRGPHKTSDAFCGVKAYRTTNVDASNGATIQWEGKVWDTGGFIASLPTANIVIPRNGWYSCIAYINTTVYTYHVGRIDILINGTIFDSERLQMNNNSTQGLMNANSVYMADRYCYTGDVITVAWDTNGMTGITLHNGGENGCACTVWRTG